MRISAEEGRWRRGDARGDEHGAGAGHGLREGTACRRVQRHLVLGRTEEAAWGQCCDAR